jgi:hypothetical protein
MRQKSLRRDPILHPGDSRRELFDCEISFTHFLQVTHAFFPGFRGDVVPLAQHEN